MFIKYYYSPKRAVNSFWKGEIFASFLITLGTFSITKSISSSFVKRLKENLMLPWSDVKGVCIALRTWLGSKLPDVQAEPELAQILSSSKCNKISSPSIYSKPMFVVLGTLLDVLAFHLAFFTFDKMPCSSLSLNLFTSLFSYSSAFCASSAAFFNPAI